MHQLHELLNHFLAIINQQGNATMFKPSCKSLHILVCPLRSHDRFELDWSRLVAIISILVREVVPQSP